MDRHFRGIAEAGLVTFLLSACGGSNPVDPDPIVKPNLSIFVADGYQPRDGMSITQGESLVCKAVIVDNNGNVLDSAMYTETWTVDGVTVACDSIPTTSTSTGREFVRGAPPISIGPELGVGEHTSHYTACLKDNPTICVASKVTKVVVKAAPTDFLIYSGKKGSDWCHFTEAEGERTTLFCKPVLMGTPEISPDDKLVAYTRDPQSSGCGEINSFIAYRDGSSERKLGDCSVIGGANFVRFMPDGKSVLVGGVRPNGSDPEFFLVSIEDGSTRVVRPEPWCQKDFFGPTGPFPCYGSHPGVAAVDSQGNLLFSAWWVTAKTQKKWIGQYVVIRLNPSTGAVTRLFEDISAPWGESSSATLPVIRDITPDGKWLVGSMGNPFADDPQIGIVMPSTGGSPVEITLPANGNIGWVSASANGDYCFRKGAVTTRLYCVDDEGRQTREIYHSDLQEIVTPNRWPRWK